MTDYWILQIICGEPILRGPFASDAERESEFDMCLIDPGTEYIIMLDPTGTGHPDKPLAWKPSWAYRKERLDRIDRLEN